MNKLRLSLAGYEVLSKVLAVVLDEASSDRAERWLEDEVCPVCHELTLSRGFRLKARWSVDHLEPGVQTPERRLVEATDAAIVRFAAELVAASGPDEAQIQRGVMPVETCQTLRWIADRPWHDLVSAEEYFHAHRRLHLRTSNLEHTQRFDGLRELRVPLGDYVARGMFARIDYWFALLESAWKVFLTGSHPYEVQERVFAAKINLDDSIEQLRTVCSAGADVRLREAATTLTQVYVAYSPAPQIAWLGCPPDWGKAEQASIRSVIRRPGQIHLAERDAAGNLLLRQTTAASLCDPTVLRHIAAALSDASAFYEAPADSDDMVEWAKDRARLLLVDRSPREVYWDGVAVAADWDRSTNEWNLLWNLARHSNRVVDDGMLIAPQGEAIRSRRSRLSRLLMESASGLDAAIETIRSQGYRLNLDAEDVWLLRDDGTGHLVNEGAARSLP